MFKVVTSIILFVVIISSLSQANAQYGLSSSTRLPQQIFHDFAKDQARNDVLRYYVVNHVYKYQVTMKDSSVKEVKSKFYIDDKTKKSYLTYEDKNAPGSKKDRQKKIFCFETLNISRDKLIGTPNDSCWLFKAIQGNINVYSDVSEGYSRNRLPLRAFQIGDGPILKLDSATLDPIFKTNPKAYEAFLKKDYDKAIKKFNEN